MHELSPTTNVLRVGVDGSDQLGMLEGRHVLDLVQRPHDIAVDRGQLCSGVATVPTMLAMPVAASKAVAGRNRATRAYLPLFRRVPCTQPPGSTAWRALRTSATDCGSSSTNRPASRAGSVAPSAATPAAAATRASAPGASIGPALPTRERSTSPDHVRATAWRSPTGSRTPSPSPRGPAASITPDVAAVRWARTPSCSSSTPSVDKAATYATSPGGPEAESSWSSVTAALVSSKWSNVSSGSPALMSRCTVLPMAFSTS